MIIFLIKLAGLALIMICLANAFAFKKLNWNENLRLTEVFFQQVFKVHTLHIVMTMLAMAFACLFTTEELLNPQTALTRGVGWFIALFWGVRTCIHIFYYEKTIKKQNPLWNIIFLGTFIYLTTLFTILAFT